MDEMIIKQIIEYIKHEKRSSFYFGVWLIINHCRVLGSVFVKSSLRLAAYAACVHIDMNILYVACMRAQCDEDR